VLFKKTDTQDFVETLFSVISSQVYLKDTPVNNGDSKNAAPRVSEIVQQSSVANTASDEKGVGKNSGQEKKTRSRTRSRSRSRRRSRSRSSELRRVRKRSTVSSPMLICIIKIRDVTELANIRIRRMRISCAKSVGCGCRFVAQSKLLAIVGFVATVIQVIQLSYLKLSSCKQTSGEQLK